MHCSSREGAGQGQPPELYGCSQWRQAAARRQRRRQRRLDALHCAQPFKNSLQYLTAALSRAPEPFRPRRQPSALTNCV